MNTQQLNMFQDNGINETVKLVSLKMVCEDTFKYSDSITSAQDIVELVKPFYDEGWREVVVSVCMNTNNRPTAIGIVSVGSVNQSLVSPSSVWKLALVTNSSSIILVHNHPAGTLKPSEADQNITSILKQGSKLLEIELLDHLIINPAFEYYSFRTNNLL